MGSPCDTDVKWILRAGFSVDPSTFANNLTILCTVAFSATVLYVVYSNSGKRPHYTDNNIQVCFPDDEEISEDDHTTQCETCCRHPIVGSSDRSKPPDSLMSFGILLEDVQSPWPPRACRLDSSVNVNLTNDRLGDSGTLVASGHNATNDVGILDGRQDGKCSGNNNAEALNLPWLTTSDLNSSYDVKMAAEVVVDGNLTSIESSCTQTEPSATSIASGTKVIESSCRQTLPSTTTAASGPDVIESSCTQTEPATTKTTPDGPNVINVIKSSCRQTTPSTTTAASGPDVIESSCTQTSPSTSKIAPDGPNVMESSCTKTLPSTTSTASGPNGAADVSRATGNVDDTNMHAPAQILPLSGRALDPLSSSKTMSAGVSTLDQPFALLKERSEAHRDVRFMRENAHFRYDPHFSRARVDLLRHCEESESQRRSRKLKDSAEYLHSMEEEDGDESHYTYGIIRDKGSTSFKHRLCGGVSFAKERREQGDADFFLERTGIGKKIGSRYQDTCTQIEGGKTSDECGSTGTSQKVVEGIREMNFDTVLCKDKGTSTSVDIYSDSSARVACTGRPLNQTNTVSKEKTHPLLGKKIENCRDKGLSTPVDTFPASSTKGPWTGRPWKQTRTMPKEETRHSIDDNLGVFERCAEERREGGITSVHSQPVDPLEQTKRSLKALTETRHWLQMSLPEQYEFLGLLDSTLAAASEQLNGRATGTSRTGGRRIQPLHRKFQDYPLSKPQDESAYFSRYTPGHHEVPALQTSSQKCPTPNMAHSCFQGDANYTNIPNSSRRQVEQYNVGRNGHRRQHCEKVTFVETQLVMPEKQGNRAQASHFQEKYQPLSLTTTYDNFSQKLSRSLSNNLREESNRRTSVCPQTQNLHCKAARETSAITRCKQSIPNTNVSKPVLGHY